jgi:hypothetical protein
MPPNEVRAPESTDPLALRREDLVGLASAYKRESRGRRTFVGVMTAMGFLLLGPLLLLLGQSEGWRLLEAVGLPLSWALFAGSFALVMRRERRIRARYEIRCPQCDASLLGGPGRPGGVTHAELAIATGCCPSCGAQILAP